MTVITCCCAHPCQICVRTERQTYRQDPVMATRHSHLILKINGPNGLAINIQFTHLYLDSFGILYTVSSDHFN